ncbi:MAG TPA: serine hydrolase domain-containing protein [Gaiellaceae bacterium]
MTSPPRALRRELGKIVSRSEGLVPAVSLAYAQDEEIVTAEWGAEPETLFQAASISKPVTALLALRLVADGELSLDGDIATPLDTHITLRLLLCHGAALSVFGFPGYARGEALPSLQGILDGSPPANNEPVRSVGEPRLEAAYSGGGYMVIQQLIEDATHEPFASLAAERIFSPLHMESATFAQPLPRELEPLAARGFSAGRIVEGGWRVYPELAAAGLWCTPTDLVRFARGVQDAFEGERGAIVPQPLAAEMLTPQFPGWGLGVGLLGSPEDPRFGHTGGNAGYRCELVASARRGLAVAVMTNADEGGALVPQLVNRLAGR